MERFELFFGFFGTGWGLAGMLQLLSLPVFVALVLGATAATRLVSSLGGPRPTRRRWWAEIWYLVHIAIVITTIGYLVILSIQHTETTTFTLPAECPLNAGDGAPTIPSYNAFRQAFQEAYEDAGGKSELGCAADEMEAGWGPGVHQNFSGPDGLAVLASIDPDTIVVLTPDLRRCVNSAVDGENTLPVALYPARDPYPVEHGLAIELGAAMDHDSQPNAVIRDDRRDTCTWVQKDFWPYYESNGGPSGPLGYPLDRAHNEGDDKIQEFENGSIVLRSDGSLVAIAHGDGRSGPPSTLAPPGRSSSDGPADAAPGPGELAYRVSSQYGVSYPIEPGGYVEQEFTSQREAVHTVAVNAAWDSSRVSGTTFSMRLELYEADGRLLVAGNVDVTEENMNRDISLPVAPVEVEPGTTLRLRAVNTSPEDLNILLGDPALPGSRVVPQACALVVGHADDPRPSYRAVGRSCALSGFVG